MESLFDFHSHSCCVHLLKRRCVSRQGPNETDVHLAVHPECGSLWGTVSDVNAGLDLANIKTIVSFGVRTRVVHLRVRKSAD